MPTLNFETKGNKGNPPILFIHGFGLNRKSWQDISPMLAENFILYLVDLIGFGDSAAPEDWPYTMDAQAEVVLDFILDKKFSNIILAGHSYGGGVTLMVLRKMIEKGHADIVRKVLLIAPAVYPQKLPFFVRIPCIPVFGRLLLKWGGAFQIKMTLWIIFHNKKAATWKRSLRYEGHLTTYPRRNALMRTAANIIPKDAERILEDIKKIQHEIFLIYGEKDSVIEKANLEKLASMLPNAVTRTVTNCGHVPHEEHPELVARLISDFL